MKKIAIIDFGGQYTHLIARRIRQLNVFSDIVQPESFELTDEIAGIVLSGGPRSVNLEDAYRIDLDIESINIPVLGICYGHQLLASMLGGRIESGNNNEYGYTKVSFETKRRLFHNLKEESTVWMSHGDHVADLPEGIMVIARSRSVPIAAFEAEERDLFGLQFHPEVTHTTDGMKILDNFLTICNCGRNWKIRNYKEELIEQIREKAEGRHLILLLSGGVDSMVALRLCIDALGKEAVYSIHVDTGLMRLNETKELVEHFKKLGFENIDIVNAEKRFLKELHGVTDPEEKRLIIGRLFVDIVNDALRDKKLSDNWMLVQGTIYPDTIESGDAQKAATIKTHHNRVMEIDELIKAGKVIEPLKDLYKDEVRLLGEELGLPHHLVHRHPFPGPGLAIRLIASDKDKPEDDYQKEADELNQILTACNMSGMILPIKSVGVQGDFRTYNHPAVIWSDQKLDLDWEVLKEVSALVINRLRTVNRVVLSLLPLPKEPQMTKLFLEKTNLDQLRDVDAYLREEIADIDEIWQMPVVMLPLKIDDKFIFVIRPICSKDAMTADVYQMDSRLLQKIERTLRDEYNVGMIFYDITTKPPGTIEWE